MAGARNAMEIFSVLDKSNCKKCGEKTCLAFAGAVFTGMRKIGECPSLSDADKARFSSEVSNGKRPEEEMEEYIASLKKEVGRLDFAAVAERVGGSVVTGELTLKVLGKKFGITNNGQFVTDLHIIPWLVIPLMDYLLNCSGAPVSGEWISFREISGGKEKYALFKKRGEDVLKHLADKYTDFFDDIVHMFDGRAVAEQFESDVSVVLYPLPLIPIMICYWQPEDGLESSLNLYFDKNIEKNLSADSIFFLGTGLAAMFDKLAEHHGF